MSPPASLRLRALQYGFPPSLAMHLKLRRILSGDITDRQEDNSLYSEMQAVHSDARRADSA
jgi:hypothetical protein